MGLALKVLAFGSVLMEKDPERVAVVQALEWNLMALMVQAAKLAQNQRRGAAGMAVGL
jgi:hypothetical protein